MIYLCGWFGMDADAQSERLQEENVEEQMDPVLWSNLSDHFLDQILASLPIACILRMRAVCKKWKRIISSDSFLKAHARISSRKPYFLMFADHFQRKESFIVLASDGGLFCLVGTDLKSDSMFVCNPITRCQRKLPPMLSMEHAFVLAIVADRNEKSYKILVVGQDEDCLPSQIYDSESNSWKMTGVLKKTIHLLSGAVFHNGLLHFLTCRPNGVISFDVQRGIWHETNVFCREADLFWPLSTSCRYLFKKRGELMMVVGIEESFSLKSIDFWRLIGGTNSWIEVKKEVDPLLRLFFELGNFICVCHGDQICFYNSHYPNVIMYNFVRDAWSWLPSCPIDGNFEVQRVVGNFEVQCVLGFAFEPRLDVKV